MGSFIKGMPIILYEKVQVEIDPFGMPIYIEQEIVIENVLVSPSSTDDIVTSTDLTGKKAVYTLAIPKKDDHVFENKTVCFFGEKWHVLGFTLQGVETNIPLCWNKKVMVVRYG